VTPHRAAIDNLAAGLLGALGALVWCAVICPALAVLIAYLFGATR
jgi:hypothetical protein